MIDFDGVGMLGGAGCQGCKKRIIGPTCQLPRPSLADFPDVFFIFAHLIVVMRLQLSRTRNRIGLLGQV